jgi:hypothetical protein
MAPHTRFLTVPKYAHVDADLGDQHGRNQPVDARNLHQECLLRAIGLKPLANAPVERCDVRLDRFEPAQLHRQEEAVMLLDPPVERQDQIGVLSAQLAPGEIGHRLRSRLRSAAWLSTSLRR